jgi:hypothetical protein
MRKAAALAGTVGSVLFGGVLIILTLIEYDFMRSLGWEPLGLSNTDWPSGLALGPHGYIMTAAFLINGLFVIFFAVGLLQALPFTADLSRCPDSVASGRSRNDGIGFNNRPNGSYDACHFAWPHS